MILSNVVVWCRSQKIYNEVKERVAYRALYNRFKTMADKAKKENQQEAGRDYENMATAMYGMMDAYMRTFYKEQQDEEYISRYLYSSEYALRLDSLSAQQLADYYRFITSPHQDAFQQYVCQSLYRNADFFKRLHIKKRRFFFLKCFMRGLLFLPRLL